ncbi:TRAP transporter large permease [Chloroflexota bacterium]
MSAEVIGIIGIVCLLVLLAARMWIGLVMIVVGFVGIFFIKGLDHALLESRIVIWNNIAFYPMTVIPLFILMGFVTSETGIGKDLYNTVYKWLGHLRGGLAIATTGACAMLGAITGSSMSGILIMSKVALPEMRKYGYDEKLSAACIAAGSTMGILIPPSMVFILYGIMTELSIGKLFMAGLIPGILEAVFYMVTIYTMCRINPKLGPPGPKTGFKEKIVSLKGTWAMLTLFLIVMGGIYAGVFTPTEAGGVGAFGAILITTISRKLSRRGLVNALREATITTGMVLPMLVGVYFFMHFMAVSKLPFLLGELVTTMQVPTIVIIIAIVVIYIVLGCFLPAIPSVLLTIPILYPVILAAGLDPIWFGVIIVRMVEIGSITPPMGINVFVLCGITGIPIGTLYRGIIPFVLADFAHVALLIAVPAISLWLPSMML